MPRKTNASKISTVEEELNYMDKLWSKFDTLEKVVILTISFLYLYFIIVVLASYNNLSKSAEPTSGKLVFGLVIAAAVITVSPIIAHYFGISTYGVIHIISLIGVVAFVAALWILFESFDKRELNTETYKDPYSIGMYFLLISFSVIYVIGSISRKF